MTTYFFHNPDGSIYSTVLNNVVPMCNPYHNFATGLDPYSADDRKPTDAQAVISSDTYRNDTGKEVGAGGWDNPWQAPDDGYYSESLPSPISPPFTGYATPGGFSYGATLDPSQGGPYDGGNYRHPDPERIRKYHTLHSLLPHLHPERLQNACSGPTLDIVEEQTHNVLAYAVPKKLLVLFCGRPVVKHYLRTLEREDAENWEGAPVKQELRIPRASTNHIGVKILITWMYRACYTNTEEMLPIRVPKNLFAAISLARALDTFHLHRDANRVDSYIANHHYNRPVFVDEIISIWNCLPKDSRYTYRMIEDLREQIAQFENGKKKALPEAETVMDFLTLNPQLKARVENKEVNNRDEFKPFFGTDWCARAALQTQRMLASMTNSLAEDTAVGSSGGGMAAYSQFKTHLGNGKRTTSKKGKHHSQDIQSGHTRKNKNKKTPRSKSQGWTPSLMLGDWQDQTPPPAWPTFEKSVVLDLSATVDGENKKHD